MSICNKRQRDCIMVKVLRLFHHPICEDLVRSRVGKVRIVTRGSSFLFTLFSSSSHL